MSRHLAGQGRWIAVAAAIWVVGLAMSGTAQQSAPAQTKPREIDFNWDIRPILSENCFQCHGPSASSRQAGMRLDIPEGAYTQRGTADDPRWPVVPGDPDASEMIRRITHPVRAVQMPPASTNKTLTDEEVALLREWIEQGAEYKPHWAYITPTRPEPPALGATGVRAVTNIDRFVFARLEAEGLRPSAETDKETLINRVSLTLTGLPPTLEDVDAFVADARPDAYERLVDRLLASTRYAERMATCWMNLARWADTDGFLDDHHDRFLWPWRDWVIDAFARNMPFDQFSTWQLAGDLLPNPTREQRLATAFLQVGPRTTENGAIDEEYRVESVIDKTNTIGDAFLALTVGCARCHDHKYDVISQRDFYSLGAFFNSLDEPGFYPPGHSTVTAGPTLLWPADQQAAAITDAEEAIEREQDAYEAVRTAAVAEAGARVNELLAGPPSALAERLQTSIDAATVAHYPFDEVILYTDDDALPEPRAQATAPPELVQPTRRGRGSDPPPAAAPPGADGDDADADDGSPNVPPRFDGSTLPRGYIREGLAYSPASTSGTAPAILSESIVREGFSGNALFFDENNKGFLDDDVGRFERTEEFTLDLWFYQGWVYEFHPSEQIGATGKGLPYGVPIVQHRDDDNSGGSGYRLQIEDGDLWVYLAHSRPANMIALHVKDPLPVQEWVHIAVTYDASSRAAGTTVYFNGEPVEVFVDHDTLTQSILPLNYNPVMDNFVGFSFGQRMREKPPVDSGLDELRFFDKALTPVEVKYLHEQATALQGDPDALRVALTEFVVANDPDVVATKRELDAAREVHNQIVSIVPEVMVSRDAPAVRPAYRLNLGRYNERAETVTPQGLDQVFPWDPTLPQNRLGLTQWLFDPAHPLVSQVFINRMWQMHFGIGLVDTSENFGAQGSVPTHPDLLDWLVVELVESGWDVKHMHRLIVNSAVYRQVSDAIDELLTADPQNTLLARGPRFQMPAEMVRDHALAASELLNDEVGGPSLYPYQPSGVWNPGNTSHVYPEPNSVPDNHHRRSMYTFIKRTAINPKMQLFDFPDRNLSSVRRQISNTPLQALNLLNDPQYIEAYRALATSAMGVSPEIDGQLTRLFRLATRRAPRTDELELLREFYTGELDRYQGAPENAEAFVSIGITEVDPSIDRPRLAALTSVAALIMNSPDAYTIR